MYQYPKPTFEQNLNDCTCKNIRRYDYIRLRFVRSFTMIYVAFYSTVCSQMTTQGKVNQTCMMVQRAAAVLRHYTSPNRKTGDDKLVLHVYYNADVMQDVVTTSLRYRACLSARF